MQNRNAVALAAVLTMTASPLMAQESQSGIGKSNFSYSTVGGYLGRVTPDQEIVVLDEVYDDFGAAGINGSLQLADHLAIGAALDVIANEGNRTEITGTSVGLSVLVPVPIGDRVDIFPSIGFVRSEVEACVDNFCVTEDDSALSYGLFTRIWVVPGALEISGGFSDTDEDNSDSTTSIGAALWFREHHSIELDFDRSDSFDAVTVGYRYSL
ncbi:porin family protein [Marinobacter pelagius]|uniref:porin family protein n=1 Tax=Marinobacter sp. C7 TaxID=2951363 RepID=UPI001EEF8C15|nr:porin family protein [Marinobacter sp. C7]MCG7198745.1 porin family protein [Marinobacter sp. C7]